MVMVMVMVKRKRKTMEDGRSEVEGGRLHVQKQKERDPFCIRFRPPLKKGASPYSPVT